MPITARVVRSAAVRAAPVVGIRRCIYRDAPIPARSGEFAGVSAFDDAEVTCQPWRRERICQACGRSEAALVRAVGEASRSWRTTRPVAI